MGHMCPELCAHRHHVLDRVPIVAETGAVPPLNGYRFYVFMAVYVCVYDAATHRAALFRGTGHGGKLLLVRAMRVKRMVHP